MEHFFWFERVGLYALIGCYQVWAYWKRKSTVVKLLPLWILFIGSVVVQAFTSSLLWFVLWYPITEAAMWGLAAITFLETILAVYRKQHRKWVGLCSMLLVLILLINELAKFS